MLNKASWKELLASAQRGDVLAQSQVGDHYCFGLVTTTNEVIVKQNFSLAFSWYEKAAGNGGIAALTNMADLLSEGKGCEKNTGKAIKHYLSAIEKGQGRAAFNLGTIYRDKGKLTKAFEYYALADKMDKGVYSFTAGLCIYYGIGVAVDKRIACQYLLKVSVNKRQKYSLYEVDEANYLLGLSYLAGEGVKQSLRKANAFLRLANKDNDHRSAAQLLFIIGRSNLL